MNSKSSRAVQIIERLVKDGTLGADAIARELVVRPKTLEEYRAGTAPMPLDRQLCLALVLMQLPAPYARMGFRLRDQVSAAMRYEQHITATHDGPPLASRRF